jgi:hypothetical protein
MAPGELCSEGFLGTDRRSVGDIIEADRATLDALGVSSEAIAARLRDAFDKARAQLGARVVLDARLSAVYHDAIGRIECPWPGCGAFEKGEIEVADSQSGNVLHFTPLNVHLVAAHGFCEGKGSRYRLEPGELFKFFRMGRT